MIDRQQYLEKDKRSVEVSPIRQALEWGPEPIDSQVFATQIVESAGSSYLNGARKKEIRVGLATAESELVTESFRSGTEEAVALSQELLAGREFNWWNLPKYREKMQGVFDVTSEGQFVAVLGNYAIQRVAGAGPLMITNHNSLFPENDGKFVDALTNATVTNFGQGYPSQILAANTMTRVTGGAQCIPYHPGPLMDIAAEALLSITPIEQKGAKVAWFNSGGDAVSVGIAAAEKYTEKVKGENGRRKAVYFKEAYHGNIEGRAGRTTGGINQMFHAEDRNSVELEYPNKPLEVEPVLAEIGDLITSNKASCIVFESTQGDGGGVSMHPDFFVELMKMSLDTQTPLICDEVQSGFGRSGRIFDVEYLLEHWKNSSHVQIEGYPEKPPMIMAVAKSMTNGAAPGSAVILPEEYAVLSRAQGLNTYSAHPATLAATIATVGLMNEATLMMVKDKRRVFNEAISPFIKPDSLIKGIRGNGLHLFLEMDEREITNASNNQILQVELLGKKRILTGTVARGALRVHAPINAPDVVWQALGKTIGEVSVAIQEGCITNETLQILQKGGPSGLASRS